jgi:hypothetical protein
MVGHWKNLPQEGIPINEAIPKQTHIIGFHNKGHRAVKNSQASDSMIHATVAAPSHLQYCSVRQAARTQQ